MSRSAAHAAHPDEELPEGIIELLDVSEHAQACMVRPQAASGLFSTGGCNALYAPPSLAAGMAAAGTATARKARNFLYRERG